MSYMYKLLIQTGDGVTYTPDAVPPQAEVDTRPVAQTILGVHAGVLTGKGCSIHVTVLPASEEGEPPVVILRFE
jgi:hypothetical protein